MKFFYLIIILGLIILGFILSLFNFNFLNKEIIQENNLSINQNVNILSGLKNCNPDYTCQEGYICDRSILCPKGNECNNPTGDLKCHQICNSSSDCRAPFSNCIKRSLFRGDYSEFVKMCFSEECSDYGKIVMPGELCCATEYVIGDKVYCVKDSPKNIPLGTCAGPGEWSYGNISCCNGLKKAFPETVAGFCLYNV